MPDKKFGPADDETETTRMPRKILKLAEEYSLPTGAQPRSLFTLRHITENSKQIFPGKEQRGYSPTQFLHSCFCERFIYSSDRSAYSAGRNYRWANVGIYRSLTDTCGNWDWGRAIPFLENT